MSRKENLFRLFERRPEEGLAEVERLVVALMPAEQAKKRPLRG